MKKLIFLLFSVSLFLTGKAQSPDSFNYQAVIRDASGNILANTQVLIELEILQGSSYDSLVYSEAWDLRTNVLGLINIEVGAKDSIGFQFINWAKGPYFLALRVDGVLLGISQLLSVPYALHAKTADRVTNLDFTINGNEPAFTNWDKDVTDDFDGKYNSLNGKPTLVSAFKNDAGYLTNDSIAHLTIGINPDDIARWNNKQDQLSGNEAIFNGWDKDASDDFDGSYANLIGRPTRLGQFSNDVGFITAEVDASVSNEIQVLSISNDTVFLSMGGFVKLPAETDPAFLAWDKSSGISITMAQISDLSNIESPAVFEKELTNGENNIDVGFKLETTSLVFYNGTILSTAIWSGTGTQILKLNMNTNLYDNLKVKK